MEDVLSCPRPSDVGPVTSQPTVEKCGSKRRCFLTLLRVLVRYQMAERAVGATLIVIESPPFGPRWVDFIKAAKAGDRAGQQQVDSRWQQNATQIADFLAKANPNWPKNTLADLMKKHFSTTTNEVVARLNKDWDADVRAFDEVYEHILHMADALSDGIVKQFPNKFA